MFLGTPKRLDGANLGQIGINVKKSDCQKEAERKVSKIMKELNLFNQYYKRASSNKLLMYSDPNLINRVAIKAIKKDKILSST